MRSGAPNESGRRLWIRTQNITLQRPGARDARLPAAERERYANVLAKGAAHRAHRHPKNFLSGVYYVRIDAGADTINFHAPRSQTVIIRPAVEQLTAENTDQVVVRVKDGTLLIFLADLYQSTPL